MESQEFAMNDSKDDAARMLAEVEAAKAELARRAVAPAWYHPALGLLMGGLVAVQAAPLPLVLAYYAIFGVGCWRLVAAYRRRTGMWINGYRPGRTRLVALLLAAVFAAIMLACVYAHRELGLAWAPYAGGAVVAILVTIGGFVWEAAFRRDLRDGDTL
jgi:hypothetical protein